MKQTIRLQNIEQFRRLLKNNPDDAEREVLQSLLAEELAAEAASAETPTLCTHESPELAAGPCVTPPGNANESHGVPLNPGDALPWLPSRTAIQSGT